MAIRLATSSLVWVLPLVCCAVGSGFEVTDDHGNLKVLSIVDTDVDVDVDVDADDSAEGGGFLVGTELSTMTVTSGDGRPEWVVVGCLDGSLVGVDAGDGKASWVVSTGGSLVGTDGGPGKGSKSQIRGLWTDLHSAGKGKGHVEAVFDNGAVGVDENGEELDGSDQEFVLVPGLDGSVYLWVEGTGLQPLALDVKGLVDESPFLAGDGTVYSASKETNFFLVDGTTGELRESDDGQCNGECNAHGPGGILFGRTTYTVRALNATGGLRWLVWHGEYSAVSPPAIASDGYEKVAFVGTPKGGFYAVEADSGEALWATVLPSPPVSVFSIQDGQVEEVHIYGSRKDVRGRLSTPGPSGASIMTPEDVLILPAGLRDSGALIGVANPEMLPWLDLTGGPLGPLFGAAWTQKALGPGSLSDSVSSSTKDEAPVGAEGDSVSESGLVGLHHPPVLSDPWCSNCDDGLGDADSNAFLFEDEFPKHLGRNDEGSRFPGPSRTEWGGQELRFLLAAGTSLVAGLLGLGFAYQRQSKALEKMSEAAAEASKKAEEAQATIAEAEAAAAAAAAAEAEARAAAALAPRPGDSEARVGKLWVSTNILGYGSQGTIVYEGEYDGRQVAVKRLLGEFYEVAHKEIELLVASDEHPHVVRYYAQESDTRFVYLALERADGTLADVVEGWDDSELTSSWCREVLKQLVAGVCHLHELSIVHRDLKPANVLVSGGRGGGKLSVKITDMSLGRKLEGAETSFASGSVGSLGWAAPEMMRQERVGKPVDVFSLGLVMFYVISRGKHPYGERVEREVNILAGKEDLRLLDVAPEGQQLVWWMLRPDSKARPSIEEVARHPLFWDDSRKLAFLLEASDRLEFLTVDADLVIDFEKRARALMGTDDWSKELPQELLDNLGKYRKYNFSAGRDLLRVIRNKKNHFRDMSPRLQRMMGPLPGGYLSFWTKAFPHLLMETWLFFRETCSQDAAFRGYFEDK